MKPSSFAARLAGAAIGIASSLFGIGASSAQAQNVSPAEAPVAWVRYAEAATATITDWLEDEGEVATRFRAYLDQTRPAADQSTPPLALRIWIEPDGRVSRITFTPFAHEQANGDLQALIVDHSLPAPPRDMLLPLRIAVQLDPAPAETTPQGASTPAQRRRPAGEITMRAVDTGKF